jgi:septum formation protein
MLILASESPTRKALLLGAGQRFESRPAPIDERAIENEVLGKGPRAVAQKLAEAKALAVSGLAHDALVIGADQVLGFSEQLHKPRDLADARRQLWALRGKSHHLHSGVALARGGDLLWSTVETATLTMRAFSEAELDEVLAAEGEAVLGSVGSYRLEGPSIALFERIEGDYFTILGLPLLPLLAALRTHAPGERFT